SSAARMKRINNRDLICICCSVQSNKRFSQCIESAECCQSRSLKTSLSVLSITGFFTAYLHVGCETRQRKGEHRAAPRRAADFDGAVVRLDQPARDRQPQPDPALAVAVTDARAFASVETV